jgi:predicted ATPase
MWIKSFQVINYKSFEDSGEHQLARRMNVIVGQNNVGKTALLQAIAQKIQNKPHKNSRQLRGQSLNPVSRTELDFETSGSTIRNALLSRRNNVTAPLPEQFKTAPEKLFEVPIITVSAGVTGNGWVRSHHPSNNIFPAGTR